MPILSFPQPVSAASIPIGSAKFLCSAARRGFWYLLLAATVRTAQKCS